MKKSGQVVMECVDRWLLGHLLVLVVVSREQEWTGWMTIWEHVQTFYCGELCLDSRLITRKLIYHDLSGDPMGSHES